MATKLDPTTTASLTALQRDDNGMDLHITSLLVHDDTDVEGSIAALLQLPGINIVRHQATTSTDYTN